MLQFCGRQEKEKKRKRGDCQLTPRRKKGKGRKCEPHTQKKIKKYAPKATHFHTSLRKRGVKGGGGERLSILIQKKGKEERKLWWVILTCTKSNLPPNFNKGGEGGGERATLHIKFAVVERAPYHFMRGGKGGREEVPSLLRKIKKNVQ